MQPLSASELISVWEQNQGLNPIRQGLALLSAACPEMSLEQLTSLTIGQRNNLLLQLRSRTFGTDLPGTVTCPNCGVDLEFQIKVSDIFEMGNTESAESIVVEIANYKVSFRLPNSKDLLILQDENDIDSRRSILFKHCLIEVQHNVRGQTDEELPIEVVDAISNRMSQADPQAEIQVALFCPDCDHHWQAVFDIVSFFWSEINAWTRSILSEVHLLASVYGWQEADILAMNPARRKLYLDMVTA
jgi:hypothetical protein